jgi:GAF domain-containing protein
VSQFILDLFFAAIFILFIILLVKIRERTFAENKVSYYYTFAGLSVLGFVALLQLAGHQNMLFAVPFLSEEMYRNLAEVTGIIVGIALLIGGVSYWLPTRSKIGSTTTQKDLSDYPLKQIERILYNSSDSRLLLKRLIKSICRSFDFSGYAVYRFNRDKGRFVSIDHSNLEIEPITDFDYSGNENGFKLNRIREESGFDYCMPLKISGTIESAVFFVKHNSTDLTDREKTTLKDLTRILSQRLTAVYLQRKNGFNESCWQYLMTSERLLSSSDNIKTCLGKIYNLFSQAVGSDYLSLAIARNESNDLYRYTVGINGNVLVDDIDLIDSDHVGSLFKSCGLRNLLATPVIGNGRIVGVVTLGSRLPGKFKKSDKLLAELLSRSLSPIIQREIYNTAISNREKLLENIIGFDFKSKRIEKTEQYFKSAAKFILDSINTTMVQISVLNRAGTSLKKVTSRTLRPIDEGGTNGVFISEESTPRHYQAIRECRHILADQTVPEKAMNNTEIEALAFAGAKSALIIPIVIDGNPLGTITLAEMRDKTRFNYDSAIIAFCQAVAARMADGMIIRRLRELSISSTSQNETSDFENNQGLDLRQELKSPVTNLRGSLDLLKIRGSDLGGESAQIMERLERSTNQIVDLLNES